MERKTYAEIFLSSPDRNAGEARHIRFFAPNVIELHDWKSNVGEILLGETAGLVFEDEAGVAVAWMLPGERMSDTDIRRLRASRAHLFHLDTRRKALAA